MSVSLDVLRRWAVTVVLLGVWAPIPALGQGDDTDRAELSIDVLAALDGPPPPVPPAVVSRDAAGRVTLRAVRLTSPLRIDGQLDEPVYTTIPAMSDFVQTEPVEGAPATEKTEVWILFDRDNVYVVARCWESRPDRVRFSEMRRDNINVGQNDNLAWSFDTFYNRRTGFFFEINPIGGRLDGESSNEGQTNFDWNPIWDFSVGRFDGGWTVETAMPFKSLRYRPGPAQLWGFNMRRTNVSKNEFSYLCRFRPAWAVSDSDQH